MCVEEKQDLLAYTFSLFVVKQKQTLYSLRFFIVCVKKKQTPLVYTFHCLCRREAKPFGLHFSIVGLTGYNIRVRLCLIKDDTP